MSGKLLKVFRESGRPLKKENIELAMSQFRLFYDAVIKKYQSDENKLMDKETADKINSLLEKYEKRLAKKYPVVDYWPFMSSKKQIKAKIKEIGFPIAIGMQQENGELVYMICDNVQS